ncbi:MAG: hypothetical protein Q9169_001237 [Polycauliona sp. 2 TL-2023]
MRRADIRVDKRLADQTVPKAQAKSRGLGRTIVRVFQQLYTSLRGHAQLELVPSCEIKALSGGPAEAYDTQRRTRGIKFGTTLETTLTTSRRLHVRRETATPITHSILRLPLPFPLNSPPFNPPIPAMPPLLRPSIFPRLLSPFSLPVKRTFSTTPRSHLAKISILGRLAAEPELTPTSSGQDIIRYAIGTTSGPRENRQTNWWKVTSFTAEGPGRDNLMRLGKG